MGFSLVVASWGSCPLRGSGYPRRAGAPVHCGALWLRPSLSTDSRRVGGSGCSTGARWFRHTGPVVATRGLQSMASVVAAHEPGCSQHVGSPRVRDQTRVPCTGRWTLIHRTTRDVPVISTFSLNPYMFLHCPPDFLQFPVTVSFS